MNTYTTETFQKYERKRSSAKGHSLGGTSLVQYEEDGYKNNKHKTCYSEERRVKRDWREE
jgi:hypothetical protein